MGHASVKTTADLYAHVTARLERDAAARIGALVDGTSQGLCDPPVIPLGSAVAVESVEGG